MSNKVVCSFTSKDTSIDWTLIAEIVREWLEVECPRLKVMLVPSDQFMTVYPVNGFPESLDSERVIAEADMIIILGKYASRMSREHKELKGFPRIDLSMDNMKEIYGSAEHPFVTEFLSRRNQARAERIVEAVISGVIVGILMEVIKMMVF